MPKKLVVSALSERIYLASTLKNGTMGDGKVDMTDDAIRSVAEHMLAKAKGKDGFEYEFKGAGTLKWVNEKAEVSD